MKKLILAALLISTALPAYAQDHDHMHMENMQDMDHSHMEHMDMKHTLPATASAKVQPADHQPMHHDMHKMDMAEHEAMDMGSMTAMHQGHVSMPGFYGPYSMSREASGTAWLPESTPMEGIHNMYGDWTTMLHGYANLVYDHQGGPRGDEQTFVEGMGMAMANRPLGGGTLGLRAMLSPDPLIGKSGYTLLLQTGETADGEEHLIDRQHPHDLFMELATTYSHPVNKDSSAFVYLGYPGEPALGPATFMHRFSGIDNPEAPISHHWLDSTHITFGVATAGVVVQNWKVEASVFNGREPDQFRWNFDKLRLNSYSGRVTYNPAPNWSLQVSQGFIESPEALEPDVDVERTTASATYNQPIQNGNWQTTLAWGMNNNDPGDSTNAVLLESALSFKENHTVFGRAEWVEKDELFDDADPLAGEQFDVGKLSLGYVYDIPISEHVKIGIGGLGSVYALPSDLDDAYGRDPVSGMAFVRIKIK
jgi:hypothetical protein